MNLNNISDEITSKIKKNVNKLVEKKIIGNKIFKKIIAKKYSKCRFFNIGNLYTNPLNNTNSNILNIMVSDKLVFVTNKWLNQTNWLLVDNVNRYSIVNSILTILIRNVNSLDLILVKEYGWVIVDSDLFKATDLVFNIK